MIWKVIKATALETEAGRFLGDKNQPDFQTSLSHTAESLTQRRREGRFGDDTVGKSLLQRHEGMSSDAQLSSKSYVHRHMSVTPELGGRGKHIPRACEPINLAESVSSWSNNSACLKPINN